MNDLSDLYQEEILAAAKEKHNFGVMAKADAQFSQHNTACGDKIAVQIKLSQDKTIIKDLKWQGDGCVISQASISKLSQVVIGKPVATVNAYSEKELLKLLRLKSIAPGREHCLQLGLQALKKALAITI